MTNSANPPRHQFAAWARLAAGVVLVVLVLAAVFFAGGWYNGGFREREEREDFLVPGEGSSVQGFLAASRSAGITGTDPAMLADGYNVCWELWNQHSPAKQVAAGLQMDYPTLTTDQAAHFVTAAYQNLCPVPGSYDYWAYGTGG